MHTTRNLSALAAALTLSLTTPALASAARDHGVSTASVPPTAHIEPWLSPTNTAAHHAHRAHSYIQLGGPMIRVKTSTSQCAANTMHTHYVTLLCLRHTPATGLQPTGCPESSTCTLASIMHEWA